MNLDHIGSYREQPLLTPGISRPQITNPNDSQYPLTDGPIRQRIEYVEPVESASISDPSIDDREFELLYSDEFVKSISRGVKSLPELMYRNKDGFIMKEVKFDESYLSLHHLVDEYDMKVIKQQFHISRSESVSENLNRLRIYGFPESYIWLIDQFEKEPRYVKHHPVNIGLITNESHRVIHNAQCNPLEVLIINAQLSERRVRETINVVNSAENLGALGAAFSRKKIDNIRLLAKKMRIRQ